MGVYISMYILNGAQQFPSGKGEFYEENVNLDRNFAQGTTSKAKGAQLRPVGASG